MQWSFQIRNILKGENKIYNSEQIWKERDKEEDRERERKNERAAKIVSIGIRENNYNS